jgi:hypothetical protein
MKEKLIYDYEILCVFRKIKPKFIFLPMNINDFKLPDEEHILKIGEENYTS